MNWKLFGTLVSLAGRNIQRRLRKNLMVVILMAIGAAVFCTGSAAINRAAGGIHDAFVDACTADLSISSVSDLPFSVFGSDLPVIGDYETTPLVYDGLAIEAALQAEAAIAAFAYLRTSPCAILVEGYKEAAMGFGILDGEYFATFPELLPADISLPANGSPWVLLPRGRVAAIEASLGRPLVRGENLQVSMATDISFTIRNVSYAGAFSFPVENAALSKIILMDARTLGALVGLDDDITPVTEPGLPGNFDDMFNQSDPTESGIPEVSNPSGIGSQEDNLDLSDVFNFISDRTEVANLPPATHASTWHFVLIRLRAGADAEAVRAHLQAGFDQAGLTLQVREWRGTAGAVASYVLALQVVFSVALFIIGLIVLMITMNAVMVSVTERSAEIGSMRALGASRPFVAGLFVTETMLLSVAGGLAGLGLGLGLIQLLDSLRLPLDNDLLALVFGDTTLRLSADPATLLATFAAALAVGALAWIYPVRIALGIQPAGAMQKG